MCTFVELTVSDGHVFPAEAAEPAQRPRGAVVTLQEIFGVYRHNREVANGYAAAGYLAVAPSTLHRAKASVERGYEADDMQAGRYRAAAEGRVGGGVQGQLSAAV